MYSANLWYLYIYLSLWIFDNTMYKCYVHTDWNTFAAQLYLLLYQVLWWCAQWAGSWRMRSSLKNQECCINGVCSFQCLLQYLRWHNTGTCGSLNTESNVPSVMACDTSLSCLPLAYPAFPAPQSLLLLMSESTEVKVGEGTCWGDGCWTTSLYEAEECALATPTPKWCLARSLGRKGSCISTFCWTNNSTFSSIIMKFLYMIL